MGHYIHLVLQILKPIDVYWSKCLPTPGLAANTTHSCNQEKQSEVGSGLGDKTGNEAPWLCQIKNDACSTRKQSRGWCPSVNEMEPPLIAAGRSGGSMWLWFAAHGGTMVGSMQRGKKKLRKVSQYYLPRRAIWELIPIHKMQPEQTDKKLYGVRQTSALLQQDVSDKYSTGATVKRSKAKPQAQERENHMDKKTHSWTI